MCSLESAHVRDPGQVAVTVIGNGSETAKGSFQDAGQDCLHCTSGSSPYSCARSRYFAFSINSIASPYSLYATVRLGTLNAR